MTENQPRRVRQVLGALSVTLLLPAGAFASGNDDFDDNSKNGSKWGADVALALGVLTEQNQQLEFTCNNALSDGDTLRPWILERFAVSGNWTVQVDTVNMSLPAAFGQVNSGGFTLLHPTNADSEIYLELYAVDGGKGFVGNLETDDNNVGGADSGALFGPVVMGAVRMEYNGATKVATCYYDADTSDGYQWTELASYGLAGAGGTTANTNWGLSDGQQFAVWVYGYSAGMTVASGELYLDNFVETGGAPSSSGPTPVPTGSWQFGFPTGNPLLTAIASISGHYSGSFGIFGPRAYEADVAQDDAGKVMVMGTLDGVLDSNGSSDLAVAAGGVSTVDEMPTLLVKTAFAGTIDSDPVSVKTTASTPLELVDVGGGTNGFAGTADLSGSLDGVKFSLKDEPFGIPATPDAEANLSKDWILQLDIETKLVNGKETTVATALLNLPNGDQIQFPERKVKYSETKGYKLSLSKGMNITMVPATLSKKTKLKITGLTFQKVGDEWEPTGGVIGYQFLGQRGTANLLDFTQP